VTTLTFEVVNRSDGPLGTVPPRPVKVGARWFRLVGDRDQPEPDDEPEVNPYAPISRTLPPNMRTEVEVPLEVPADPGRYEVRVALHQPGVGWFGVRVQGEVVVKADR
jgi:hypothetical protein